MMTVVELFHENVLLKDSKGVELRMAGLISEVY